MKRTFKIFIFMATVCLSVSFSGLLQIETLAVSSSKSSNNEMTNSDWSLIADSASNSKGDTFDFIKNNTSQNDDGHWMLYLGIFLIIMSIIGILYVVLSSMSGKNKINKKNRGTSRKNCSNSNYSKQKNRDMKSRSNIVKSNIYEEKIASNRSTQDWDRFFRN